MIYCIILIPKPNEHKYQLTLHLLRLRNSLNGIATVCPMKDPYESYYYFFLFVTTGIYIYLFVHSDHLQDTQSLETLHNFHFGTG